MVINSKKIIRRILFSFLFFLYPFHNNAKIFLGHTADIDINRSQTLQGISEPDPLLIYEFPEFATWFKNEVDFYINKGIQKKSRDSVLIGLQNIALLTRGFNFQSSSRRELEVLSLLNQISQNYSDIFSKSQNLQETDYWNLHRDYQAVLKEATHCCQETLLAHKAVWNFIAKQNQVAFAQHVWFVGGVIFFGIGTIYLGFLILNEEMILNYAHDYAVLLKFCQNQTKVSPMTMINRYQFKKHATLCSESQEEIKAKGGGNLVVMCEIRKDLITCLSQNGS